MLSSSPSKAKELHPDAAVNHASLHEPAFTDLDACIAMMRGGSKSFFAASKLLPTRMRSASIALYAFCRVADDVVDEGENPEQGLIELRGRLDSIYQGNPQDFLEDQALAIVVHHYQLPRPLLDALLEGFSWDFEGRDYPTLQALHTYCARVAGTVGAMMAWIMGARNSNTLARACELGVAMQLTNIARDVGEDARNGRLYLPHEWLREAGVDPHRWLENPTANDGVKDVIARVLRHSNELYDQSSAGIADLPRDCRAAIMAARLIYAEIGKQIERDGLHSVERRTVVSATRKVALIAQAKVQSVWTLSLDPKPAPLAAIQFLVDACQEDSGIRATLPSGFPNRSITERLVWLVKLFERLSNQSHDHKEPLPPYKGRKGYASLLD